MQMAARFRKNRALSILLGYNLPLILWTAATVYQAWTGRGLPGACPVRALLHWCPSCGLTSAYALLFSEGRIADVKFLVIWAAMLFNLLWSIWLIMHRPATR